LQTTAENLLNRTILAHWQTLTKRAIAVYTAIYGLSSAGCCDAYQEVLAQTVGMGTRNLRRAVAELEEAGLLAVERYYSTQNRRTKNRYILLDWATDPPPQPDSMLSDDPPPQPDSMESDHSTDQPDSMLSADPPPQPDSILSDQPGQPDNMESAMMFHDDDDRNKSERELILQYFDFLHEGERRKRAKQRHVTATYAKQWRAWWERCDFGQLTNPAGFANEAIKKGHPPPQQQALPGGVLFDQGDFLWGAPKKVECETAHSEDEKAWQATLAQLERQMTRATFDTWLRGTRPIGREGETVIIGVKYHNAKTWIDNRLYDTISRTAASYGLTYLRFEVEAESDMIIG